jgi:hypothetical protein
MSAPRETKEMRKGWSRVLGAVALSIAGTVVYGAMMFPVIEGSLSVALVTGSCLVGALCGLLGYQVGTFLDRIRK